MFEPSVLRAQACRPQELGAPAEVCSDAKACTLYRLSFIDMASGLPKTGAGNHTKDSRQGKSKQRRLQYGCALYFEESKVFDRRTISGRSIGQDQEESPAAGLLIFQTPASMGSWWTAVLLLAQPCFRNLLRFGEFLE